MAGSGRAVVVAPFDYFRWTRRGEEFIRHLDGRIPDGVRYREIWLTGRISIRARRELGAAGWAVFDQAGTRI